MDWKKVWTIKTGYLERDLGDEILFMAEDGNTVHNIDGVGLPVWNRIREGQNGTQIITALLKEYDVTESQLKEDLTIFFKEMQDSGLIE